MLNLGWVDFSKSDRDTVLSVLRQLTESGAMDELGIGTVRDAFADILFPGTCWRNWRMRRQEFSERS